MFRSIIFLSAVFALTSCAQKKQDQQNTDNSIVDSVAVINDPKQKLEDYEFLDFLKAFHY